MKKIMLALIFTAVTLSTHVASAIWVNNETPNDIKVVWKVGPTTQSAIILANTNADLLPSNIETVSAYSTDGAKEYFITYAPDWHGFTGHYNIGGIKR